MQEHYYHTLFGYMEKDYETDCKGSVSFSDFSNSVAGHPKKYTVRMFTSRPCNPAVVAKTCMPGTHTQLNHSRVQLHCR